jgi:hypothetical protein
MFLSMTLPNTSVTGLAKLVIPSLIYREQCSRVFSEQIKLVEQGDKKIWMKR